MARSKAHAGAVRVQLLTPVMTGGQRHETGAEIDVPAREAETLIASGAAIGAATRGLKQAAPAPAAAVNLFGDAPPAAD